MGTNAVRSDRLDEIARLTREYASYSRDAAGLGDVIGGVLFFLTAFFWTGYHGIWERTLIVSAPFVWIAAKEWLQRKYYQVDGRVEQSTTLAHRIALWVFTTCTVALSLSIAYQIVEGAKGGSAGTLVRAGISLLILFALPILVGRYLRGGNEYFVGIWLLMNSASAIYGKMPLLGFTSFIFLFAGLCALVLISEGLKQHKNFREIRGRLLSLRSAQ